MSHTSNQTWDLHRGSNMMLPLTLPCRQAAKHWTSGTDNKQSCRRYRHEVGPYHAVESDVRSEISVFMPKSNSHSIFPIVILRNSNLWDVNTMKKNPCNRSCRCQSVWHEKKFKKPEHNCEISKFTLESHFNWHDSVLQVQYRQINLLRHWENAWLNVPCASAHRHHR